MDKILEFKGVLVKTYAAYSRYIDKVLVFILGILTFTFINQHMGYMKVLANPLTTVAISLICTFLPLCIMVILATTVSLVQLFSASVGLAIVVSVIFLVIYALYLRFTPGKSIVLLLIPVAYMLQIPMLIPILFGLLGTPIYILPIMMGTIIYYMIWYLDSYSNVIGNVAKTNVSEQLAVYTQQIFTSREMWCAILAFALTLLVVYGIRKLSVDHAWEISIIAGAMTYVIALALGYVTSGMELLYGKEILATIGSVILAFLVEIFVFSVDYSQSEYLQFEDDEYYYYVKAVPKAYIPKKEKTVKRIHERQETTTIDSEQVNEAIQQEKEMEESEIQKIINQELKDEIKE